MNIPTYQVLPSRKVFKCVDDVMAHLSSFMSLNLSTENVRYIIIRDMKPGESKWFGALNTTHVVTRLA